VFDAVRLRDILGARLAESGVRIVLGARVREVSFAPGEIVLCVEGGEDVAVERVFNCTYSGMNSIRGLHRTRTRLKHEIAELAFVHLPPELSGLAVTVMDGPFFSIMPFPANGQATLSHVRYTPHAEWREADGDEAPCEPYELLASIERPTAYGHMIRDAARYLPALRAAEYRGSFFEVKTVLEAHERDDGRPILWDRSAEHPEVVSILGSKIDNVYDVLAAMEAEFGQSA
jgi:hypothetical protein